MFNVPPKFLTLAQLLEKRLFQIPPYQRTYSWKLKERRDMFNLNSYTYSRTNSGLYFRRSMMKKKPIPFLRC